MKYFCVARGFVLRDTPYILNDHQSAFTLKRISDRRYGNQNSSIVALEHGRYAVKRYCRDEKKWGFVHDIYS